MTTLNILALSGSLRAHSTNTGLLVAAGQATPEADPQVLVSVYDYSDVPLFNSDIALPRAVEQLNAAIAAADGLLLAVPEYNYSIPGVLKNAIDWVSRPAYSSVFRDKPTGVMSAAASFVGGARAQQHSKSILLAMGTPVFPWPELLVGGAHRKFKHGQLEDAATREVLSEYMDGFAKWVARTKLA